MSRFAAGSIAGVALESTGGTGCRVNLVDAEGFRNSILGNSVTALDSTVHTQLSDRGVRDIHFGVQFPSLPVSVLDDVVAAINAAVADGEPFQVTLADASGVDAVDAMCVPDYRALGNRLFTRGDFSEGHIKNVVMRFISVAPGE